MAPASILFFLQSMEHYIYIKRRFMLMSVIYGYFYSILEIIIWTVSVWMKIIFYSSLEKLSAVVGNRFPSFPTHDLTSQWKWLFFFFSTTICFAFWMRSSFSFRLQSMVGRIDGLLYYSFIFLWPSWFGVYVIFCIFAHSLFRQGDVYFWEIWK